MNVDEVEGPNKLKDEGDDVYSVLFAEKMVTNHLLDALRVLIDKSGRQFTVPLGALVYTVGVEFH